MSVAVVLGAAFVTALATGLGALPLLFERRVGTSHLGLATAAAAGFMLGASAGLLWEGSRDNTDGMLLGAFTGGVFLFVSRRLLGHRRGLEFGALRGADALGALMIVGVMTLHSFPEGIGVGVAFGDSETFGGLITAAIALHNIPEGLAISLVLVPKGISVVRAGAWSVFSSLPQPLMAVPAFLLAEWFQAFLPFGLGFAGGAMLWMAGSQLVPEALRTSRPMPVAVAVVAAAAAMIGLQLLLLA
ncbi:MAG TPA: ZIP family metal transporter [Gaiellaceae bacterium]